MELLTCPKCLHQMQTAKALQFGDDKAIKCKSCGFVHSLGVARGRVQSYTPAQPVPVMQAMPAQPQVVYVERPRDDRLATMIAAIATLFIPGLGHLLMGKPLAALGWFLAVLIGYAALIAPGIVLHIWCIICVLRLR